MDQQCLGIIPAAALRVEQGMLDFVQSTNLCLGSLALALIFDPCGMYMYIVDSSLGLF